MDDEIIRDEDQKPQPFKGHFLFVENSVTKTQRVDSGSAKKQTVAKTSFEKLCLVKIINNASLSYQKQASTLKDPKKPSQEQQKFEQDDFIKISESNFTIL